MADQWTYREEGNNNVVFTSTNSKHILRLPKLPKKKLNHDSACTVASFSDEMEFLEHVVYKMLHGLRVSYKAERFAISKDFIQQLARHMKERRPLDQKGETLDESVKYALMMPNFCSSVVRFSNRYALTHNLPRGPKLIMQPVISVELRPKTRYFPIFDVEPSNHLRGKCFHCIVQMYKRIMHPQTPQTDYCPCDLYSGDHSRMKKSLLDLISCPERHFSIRINDHVVFSQSVINQKIPPDCNGLRRKLTSEVFKEAISSFSRTSGDGGLEMFLDLICKRLLSPIVGAKSTQSMSYPFQQCLIDQRDNSIFSTGFLSESLKRVRQLPGLRDINILQFLHSISEMRSLPVTVVESMNQKIVSHLESYPEDVEHLSLGPPYYTDVWREAGNLSPQIINDPSVTNSKDVTSSVPNEVLTAADLLRRYVIARVFNCCSLILSFQKLEPTMSAADLPIPDSTLSDSTTRLVDNAGNIYLSSLAILDLYKDPPNQIEKFCRRERDVVNFVNEFFNHTFSPESQSLIKLCSSLR